MKAPGSLSRGRVRVETAEDGGLGEETVQGDVLSPAGLEVNGMSRCCGESGVAITTASAFRNQPVSNRWLGGHFGMLDHTPAALHFFEISWSR
jgi:hypothetical protein